MGNIEFNMKEFRSSWIFLYFVGVVNFVNGESYIPKFVEGTPDEGTVLRMVPPDLRKEDLYRIEHKVGTEKETIEDALVHRTYSEFETLDKKIRRDLFMANPPLKLPSQEVATVENIDTYFRALYTEKGIRTSTLFADFLSINWDGKDISFMYDLEGFLEMLLVARVPNFMPEPPIIEMDTFLAPETPFERYLYFLAFKHPQWETPAYLEFFDAYCETTPDWSGPEDNSDVQHPSYTADKPLEYPFHYNLTYVHFLPKGYLNGHTVRVSYLGNSKFTFLDESKLNEWFKKLYFEETQIDPKVILDVGTGTGGSAFVLGELFPEAKVMGIDLAPTYIRFDRAEKQIRKASNVEFYQANAEDMFFIESNSVDFINFAYVLHEMPAENARRVVNEMYRILKPGGVLNGLESPYERNPVAREAFVLTQTWGHDWSVQGDQGPEPYFGEYENQFKLPLYMEEVGFVTLDVNSQYLNGEYHYGYFESIFTGTKEKNS